MSRGDLFDAVKAKLGLASDRALGELLGVKRAYFCMVRAGTKDFHNRMQENIASLTGFPLSAIQAVAEGKADVRALSAVPEVLAEIQHEPGVLPGPVCGGDAESAPAAALREDQEGGKQGSGQRADLLGECRDDPAAPVPSSRPRFQRGTRAAVVLREGGIVPVERKGKKHNMVVYSTGGDTNHVCSRDTFIDWMDPTRA